MIVAVNGSTVERGDSETTRHGDSTTSPVSSRSESIGSISVVPAHLTSPPRRESILPLTELAWAIGLGRRTGSLGFGPTRKRPI